MALAGLNSSMFPLLVVSWNQKADKCSIGVSHENAQAWLLWDNQLWKWAFLCVSFFFKDIKVSRLLSGPFLFPSFGGCVLSCLTGCWHDNEGVSVYMFKRWNVGEKEKMKATRKRHFICFKLKKNKDRYQTKFHVLNKIKLRSGQSYKWFILLLLLLLFLLLSSSFKRAQNKWMKISFCSASEEFSKHGK